MPLPLPFSFSKRLQPLLPWKLYIFENSSHTQSGFQGHPFVLSWLQTRTKAEGTALQVLFEKYIPTLLENNKRFKKITPISDIAMTQMTCYLLEGLLTPHNVPAESPKEWIEIYFVFAVIWGFGSALFQDQLVDWRNEFSKWWQNEFKGVKFPSGENLFRIIFISIKKNLNKCFIWRWKHIQLLHWWRHQTI